MNKKKPFKQIIFCYSIIFFFRNKICFLKLILIQIEFLQFLPCIQIYLGIINNQGYRGRLSIFVTFFIQKRTKGLQVLSMLKDLESKRGSICIRRKHSYQIILSIDTRTTSFFLSELRTYFTIDLPLF